jgi:hypothetical protein
MVDEKPISIIVPVDVAAKMKALAKKRGLRLSALWQAAAVRHLMEDRSKKQKLEEK